MLKTWPMLKSLLWKESRELLPLVAAAVAAQIFLIGGMMRWQGNPHQDAYGIWPLLYVTAVLLAVAAGFWQTWRESLSSQFQFLLHRPLARKRIFEVKISFGLIIVMIFAALPLLCFSLWADGWMGLHIQGAQLSNASIQLCALIPLLYLGAFLSGVRAGQWYGSRFLPLFGAILLSVVIGVVGDSLVAASLWSWIAALAAGPAMAVGFVAATLHVTETRDFS